MLSGKENFLKCAHGEQPDWVPTYTMGFLGESFDKMIEPSIINEHRIRGGGPDIFGVEYVPTDSTGGAIIPKTSDFILEDIADWRDVIKVPDLSGVDWEQMVKDDFKRMNVNRENTAICMNLHMGYFQDLMSFMGFTNGLMAFYEDPDEVKALFDYLCDFYCTIGEKYGEYCDPDVWTMMDDTAAWANPFISPEMYREFLIPLYKRQAKFANDRGLPISMHNCGKAACFFDDLVNEVGVTMWDPAQTCNDLAAVKAKFGNRLVIAGGWDARDRLLDDDVTYEEIYESVKKSFDMLAPGGGYMFMGFFMGAKGDEIALKKNQMLYQAVAELDHKYY
ncbi:MAG: veratrol--corrinoid protein metyltransferase [Oscillospiraceae bacterium]|nr:veratrol--corrinoid protein metyltransferase [Oscillospiraceae bacterium]